MSNKNSRETTKAAIEPVEEIPASRIHFREFVQLHTSLTGVESAGFKASCGNKDWMFLEEWQEALDKHISK